MEVLLLGDKGKVIIFEYVPCCYRVEFGFVITDEKESLICGDLLHSSGVKMDAAEEDQDPRGAVKEPAVIAVVLVIETPGVDKTCAHHKKQCILQYTGYEKYDQP